MAAETRRAAAARRWRAVRDCVCRLLAAPDDISRWHSDRAGRPVPERRIRRKKG
ncbi:hypothetical protein ACFV4K_17750 [Nocardia sp. NPDC059764]|uniref:hypothetical protein n=1 Tax=Nocardia sp. NPDC059764 TaxID=3346939 RepID=UPI00365B88D9